MSIIKKILNGESFLSLTMSNDTYMEAETFSDHDYFYQLYNTGILAITPLLLKGEEKVGQSLILSCGIHGNETAPIEIVEELLSKICRKELKLTLPTLFILGNPRGMNIEQRFEGFNLNRLFNGTYKNIEECYEKTRAQEIEEAVESFFHEFQKSEKIHYDLHTAIKESAHEKFALYPFLHERKHCEKQISFIEDLGLDALVFSTNPSTTFSYHTSFNFNSHSFTVELGKVYRFGENPQENFKQAKTILEQLLEGSYEYSARSLKTLKLYDIEQSIIKNNDSFRFYFPDSTVNFELFQKDQKLWSEDGKDYFATKEKMRILFPNAGVKNGQRAGLLIIERS